MTKFSGDAKGNRDSKRRFPTGKEMRKDMEVFKRTGRHPGLEEARAAQERVLPLPDPDQNRPHVFLDLQRAGQPLGRVVVEVYEPEAVLAARHLLNRCREGTRETLQGTAVHRLIPDLALFLGTSRGYRGGALRVRRYPFLHHTEAGVVSLDESGGEVAIALGRSLTLDKSHQVVGVVMRNLDLIRALNETPTDEHDVPLQPITVAACGLSNAEGVHESLEEAAARAARDKETAEETRARVGREGDAARDAVRESLETRLAEPQLRPADAAAPGGQGAGGPAGPAAAKEGRPGLFDPLLEDLSDSSESEQEA